MNETTIMKTIKDEAICDLSFEEPFFERTEWFSKDVRSCLRHEFVGRICFRITGPYPNINSIMAYNVSLRVGVYKFAVMPNFYNNNFLNLTRTSSILPSHFELKNFDI